MTSEMSTRQPFAVQAEASHVRLLQAPWNTAWLEELALVPVGRHDDQADASAGAFAEVALNEGPTVMPRKITGF